MAELESFRPALSIAAKRPQVRNESMQRNTNAPRNNLSNQPTFVLSQVDARRHCHQFLERSPRRWRQVRKLRAVEAKRTITLSGAATTQYRMATRGVDETRTPTNRRARVRMHVEAQREQQRQRIGRVVAARRHARRCGRLAGPHRRVHLRAAVVRASHRAARVVSHTHRRSASTQSSPRHFAARLDDRTTAATHGPT